MGLWRRFVAWMNRGPRCIYCGKEMKRFEELGAGVWICLCDDGLRESRNELHVG
jgi:ribosomal protein L37AE/L43A